MTRKKWFIAGIVLICIVITLSVMKKTGDSTVLFPVSRVLKEAVGGVQKGITVVTRKTGDFFAYFSDNRKLRQENENLTKRVAELEESVYRLTEQEMENQRLHNMLNYKEEKKENYQLLLAKVIGRDSNNWYKTLIIDQGSADGIRKNMTVVDYKGLVGTVISVTPNTAEVLMILDSEGAVGARIFENRVTPGVVVGTGRSDYLEMIHLPHDVPIEAGQTVVSSGLGGMYPKGIRIGTVMEVKPEPNWLMKSALIKPFVDFSRLEEVFVILQTNKEEPADTSEVVSDSGENAPDSVPAKEAEVNR